MAQLNYNHLHYFWVVASLGSIVKASRMLHVTPQTISGQLRTLEERLGSRLFRKQGRRIELTETGQLVRSYAEPMFNLGAELTAVMKSVSPRNADGVKIGIASSIPKAIAARVLGAALRVEPRIACHDVSAVGPAADLRAQGFDVVLADGVVKTADLGTTSESLVGESGTTILCGRRSAESHRGAFPAALDGAAFIFPPRSSRLRRTLSAWLKDRKILPTVAAEIENPDLMAALGESSGGFFAAPTMIAADLEARYRVSTVGDIPELKQQYYLIASDAYGERDSLKRIVELAREQFVSLATAERAHEIVTAAMARLASKNDSRSTSVRGATASIRRISPRVASEPGALEA